MAITKAKQKKISESYVLENDNNGPFIVTIDEMKKFVKAPYRDLSDMVNEIDYIHNLISNYEKSSKNTFDYGKVDKDKELEDMKQKIEERITSYKNEHLSDNLEYFLTNIRKSLKNNQTDIIDYIDTPFEGNESKICSFSDIDPILNDYRNKVEISLKKIDDIEKVIKNIIDNLNKSINYIESHPNEFNNEDINNGVKHINEKINGATWCLRCMGSISKCMIEIVSATFNLSNRCIMHNFYVAKKIINN